MIVTIWVGSTHKGRGFTSLSRQKGLQGKLSVRNLNGPLDLKIISPTETQNGQFIY